MTDREKEAGKPSIEPRCLTKSQAAKYCGLTLSGFGAWQVAGIVPGPIPGTKRWDRKAIDKASGIRAPDATTNDDVEKWFAKHAARR
ncbi:hypothetical protein [Roseixanthobacter liquoris]|uniref:hypothetical protein n=1 Tax=Roseixanthobacter liquoris TaxID=3119921 RepID=UPI00372CC311